MDEVVGKSRWVSVELLRKLVAAVFLLNVADGVMTLVWVSAGLAQEANPLMDLLIGLHPSLFMGAKISLVALGCALLWRHVRLPMAAAAIFLLVFVYYSLLLYHLSFASQQLLT
jgi:hypothetical protein